MNIISDETLMAYADGELDAATRAAVEQAMQDDPAVAAKVAQLRALRADVFGAFAGVLGEPVPQRLQAIGRTGTVVQLDAVRSARAQAAGQPAPAARRRWSWPEWGAMAATLVLGVLAGSMGLGAMGGATGGEMGGETQLAALGGKDGALMAQGKLAAALSNQLSGAPPAGGQVRIGLTFETKDGNYCRSFALSGTAGLACRSGEAWAIPVLTEASGEAPGAYRRAGVAMPGAVLEAIDARIEGQSLDAAAEHAAQQKGWAPKAR
ncbi:anti-sigma factor [Massilia glaciei]|uniref:Anti-sigma factor n=1 Tax=Massilia glaciei TaxID=1524097 RepID=A0A2U2HNI4_9BURK|nr:hypothetical protein [Massilia glaciei]PWF49022.1 hypothetical protein C7C56_009045 [Massilia glaciei]